MNIALILRAQTSFPAAIFLGNPDRILCSNLEATQINTFPSEQGMRKLRPTTPSNIQILWVYLDFTPGISDSAFVKGRPEILEITSRQLIDIVLASGIEGH